MICKEEAAPSLCVTINSWNTRGSSTKGLNEMEGRWWLCSQSKCSRMCWGENHPDSLKFYSLCAIIYMSGKQTAYHNTSLRCINWVLKTQLSQWYQEIKTWKQTRSPHPVVYKIILKLLKLKREAKTQEKAPKMVGQRKRLFSLDLQQWCII